MIIKAIILFLLLVLLPVVVGCVFAPVKSNAMKLHYQWVCGQMLLWGGFQLVCVPFVIKGKDLSYLCIIYCVFVAALLFLAVGTQIKYMAEREKKISFERPTVNLGNMTHWIVFLILLAIQFILAVGLSYADGDDAYYVSTAVSAVSSNKMYTTIPYTGTPTTLDIRHGVAPFPMWVAMLAKMSGIPVAIVSHTILPIFMLILTYNIFFMIATELFEDKGDIPLFLIFTEILIIFGGYSMYTMETFLLARSRQGKATLGSAIIPFLFYLMILLLRRTDEKKHIHRRFFVLVAVTIMAGCLCSALGALLCCMFIGICGVIGFFVYKDKKSMLMLLPCCIPGVLYALVYVLLR